jgi:formylglycine-generating enzyme required for sulfatase activity
MLFGGIFAGSHYANQILTGTFLGDYSFNSSVTFNSGVNFTNANVIGLPSSSLNCSSLPGSWILVPGNAELRTLDFCVMQFEAKNVSGVATSQAALTPWVSISQTDSYKQCANLGVGYHLITDEEWVTIARSAEMTPASWSGGAVGNGYMYSGHNDGSPNAALSVSNVNDYYDQTGQTTGNQRRVLDLSNGNLIWDLSGNVMEWTQGQLNTVESDLNMGATQWNEWTSILGFYNLGPHNSSLYSTQGIGQVYTDVDAANPSGEIHAFLRGGNWNYGANAGAFALYLGIAPSASYTDVGFRCSFGN